jgi:hypothetical protein
VWSTYMTSESLIIFILDWPLQFRHVIRKFCTFGCMLSYKPNFIVFARTCYYVAMKTFDYKLVTDRYTAEGQVDAEDEKSAEALLRSQVAQPRSEQKGIMIDSKNPPKPPVIKDITLRPKKTA